MNAWNFDRKSKTMQNVDANISLYHSWYAYLREGKRVFSFHFENQKFPNNYFEQIKSKDKKHIPNSILFLKAIRWVRVSFPKRKTISTLCHMPQFCKNNIIIFYFISRQYVNFILSCNWWLRRVNDVECNSEYFNYK